MPATEQTTTGAALAGATTTTTTSSNSEEVILALQRERKNQYLSFKKFGEFKNMNSSSNKSKGKLTALGYIYVFISAIVFLLYWFVDAVDGRYASVLLLASCFVVRVHPAFSGANGKLRWWDVWEDTLFRTSKRLGCSSISSSTVVKQSLTTTTTTIRFERAAAWVCLCVF